MYDVENLFCPFENEMYVEFQLKKVWGKKIGIKILLVSKTHSH